MAPYKVFRFMSISQGGEGVVILDIAKVNSHAFIVVSRFIWYTAMLAQFSILFYQIFFYKFGIPFIEDFL